MTITSIQFLVFLVVVLVIYYLLPPRPQNYWLLLISYGFILSWDWQFALVLGVVTIVNFGIAKSLAAGSRHKRAMLWLGIGFNLLILVFFRSMGFFLPVIEQAISRLGFNPDQTALQILAPLGLSYYSLQNISYLVDVFRGQLKAETDLVNYALYLAYFPKFISGPIERARTFLPKLAHPRVVDNQVIARSLLLIFVGLVRKLLIADILSGLFLSDVFTLPAKYTPSELIIWLLMYASMLYNDFAGYMGIFRGISGLFGIELSINFKTPYFSQNFTEFWKRWHITLSEWLRDYIFFPVTRFLLMHNPVWRNVTNLVLPPMITMLVSGLWHGFSSHMLVWGGLHGVYQIVERILAFRQGPSAGWEQSKWKQGLRMGIVFILVILAWVPFGWELPAAYDFWGALFNWSSFAVRYRRFLFTIPIMAVSFIIDYSQYRSQDEFIFLKWPRLVQATCMAVIFLLVFIVTSGEFKQPFVYQGF